MSDRKYKLVKASDSMVSWMKNNKLWAVLIVAVLVALFFVLVYPYIAKKNLYNKDRMERHTKKYIHDTKKFLGLNLEKFRKTDDDVEDDDDEDEPVEDFEDEDDEEPVEEFEENNVEDEEDEENEYFQEQQFLPQGEDPVEVQQVTQDDQSMQQNLPPMVEGYQTNTNFAPLVTIKPKLIY